MGEIIKWFGEITPGGVGIWTAVGLIAVALIRQKPITQKLAYEREGNLLKERASEMREMRHRLARIEAERQVDVHRLNNVTQCLDSLLMAIELSPERAKEAAAHVKQMRADMAAAEAKEKGEIMAAVIRRSGEDTSLGREPA